MRLVLKIKTICLDANVVLNVWRKEVDSQTGAELWKDSSSLLKKIRTGEYVGVMSIVSAMEVLQPVRAALQEQGLKWEERCRRLEQSLRRYGIRFVVPDVVAMADAYEYFWTNHLDPFDAITVSVAIHQNSDVIVSRDHDLRRRAEKLIPVLEPEEF